MGYKLAGYDVIGCNEVDSKINNVYVQNHAPIYNFCCDIREMLGMDLPEELYSLDILDGSPPCSPFSMSGNRERDWGKEKRFKEGKHTQVIDTLFFDFIALAKRLRPKVIIAENVKGIVMGKAIAHLRRIYESFDDAGYYCQHFLLNSAYMGVPQRRERVFFVCLRKDLAEPFLEQVDLLGEWAPLLDMSFSEKEILFSEIADYGGKTISPLMSRLFPYRKEGDRGYQDINIRVCNKKGCFNDVFVKEDEVVPTVRSTKYLSLFSRPVYMSKNEVIKSCSFPSDYDFGGRNPLYICGMSVPPVMMAQIASRIYEQWLSKI